MSAALLELHGVSRTFGGLTAVRRVDLAVASGEIVGLIGPNGAGKTTLFNLITGVYRPNSGTIAFEGREITSLPPHARCKLGIARTFQLVRPFQNLSVLDNVTVGSVFGRQGAPTRRAGEATAHEALVLLGLDDRERMLARSLTLVDRKRLELARALAAHPKLLLLDELLAGLNPSEVVNATAMVQRIRDTGVTILMVEHLVKALFGISDRVVVLSAGEKIAEGPPSRVAVNPRVVEAYLGGEASGEAIALA